MFKERGRMLFFGGIGLILGLIVIIFGFWKMILLCCFVLLGLIFGALLDRGFSFKDFFAKFFNKRD